MECSILVDDILACKDRHELQVAGSWRAQAASELQSQRIGPGYLRNAIFYGLVGGLFTAFGVLQYRFLGLEAVFFAVIGIFLLYAGVANLSESRRFK
jgi:hypothetical protein